MKLTPEEHAFRHLVRDIIKALVAFAAQVGVRREVLFATLRDAITAEELRRR